MSQLTLGKGRVYPRGVAISVLFINSPSEDIVQQASSFLLCHEAFGDIHRFCHDQVNSVWWADIDHGRVILYQVTPIVPMCPAERTQCEIEQVVTFL